MKSGNSNRAKIIAIANQKGGVGKTTTAVTLAGALRRLDKKVLLLDLDPHANASVHLRVYPETRELNGYHLFKADPGEWEKVWGKIRVRHALGFDLVPAGIRLAELEVDLNDRPGKGVLLKEALAPVLEEYDFILLDCPPHVGVLLVNALVACDLLVIPIQTDFLALHGLKLLFDSIRILNRVLPGPIAYRALATMYDRRAKACNRVLELLHMKMDNRMFRTIIGVDTRFRDASALGRVIYEIDPESRGAREYEELAREIESL